MQNQYAKLITSNFPLLNSPELLSTIMEVASFKKVKTGEVLMDVGQYIKFMPLVVSGVIKVIRVDDPENEILLYYLEGGKTCAMSMTCCMQEVKSNIRATIEEDAEIIMIPVQYVDQWMMKFPAWKNFIMNTFSNRFDQLLQTIDTVTFKRMDDRILKYLEEKLNTSQIPFVASSKTEIASDLNTSREVISRMMKKLELDGKVKTEKGKIYLV